jgi:hypothetical protein
MLNEQSIQEALDRIVKHLSEGDAESAEFAIQDLGFDRLTRPIEDRSKQRMFVDPAAAFGVQRVHEVWDAVSACRGFMLAGDLSRALERARRAVARWNEAK